MKYTGSAYYRKKPIKIEAFIWCGGMNKQFISPYAALAFNDGTLIENKDGTLTIKTLEGNMTASIGDAIIRGVNGEFYPCKPEIFEKTYEPV